jgi:hypothetical protein
MIMKTLKTVALCICLSQGSVCAVTPNTDLGEPTNLDNPPTKSTALVVEYDYNANQLISIIKVLVREQNEMRNDIKILKKDARYIRNAAYIAAAIALLGVIVYRDTLEEMIRG